MSETDHDNLTRRERQIMDIVYELGEATAAEVQGRLPGTPAYSTVRAMLSKLEAKGHLRHRAEGPRYVFAPTVPRDRAREWAVSRLIQTFFDGSTYQAINGLLGQSSELSKDELEELARAVEKARRKGL